MSDEEREEPHQEQQLRDGQNAGGGKEPPPEPATPRPAGLRIAFYILVVIICYEVGLRGLIYLTEGAETLEALSQAQEDGQMPVQALSLLLGLKLQLLLAPILLVVTGLFAASDGRTLRDLAVAWPSERIVGPVAQLLGVLAAVVAMLGAWRLLAEPWVTFTTLAEFPADEVEALGRWLPPDVLGLALFAVAFVALGFVDEVIFRGYVYTVLRDRLPWIHCAGLSSLLFTLFRPGDPTVLAPSMLNIFLLGLLLAGLREASGSLLLGSLFHGTWNFVLGCLLSLPVSGLFMPRLKPLEIEGPLWATGGDYGPEGSWLLSGLLLLGVLAVTAWVESGKDDEEVLEASEATQIE